MYDLAVREADFKGAFALERRRHPTPDTSFHERAMVAYAHGDGAARRRIDAEAAKLTGYQPVGVAWNVATHLEDFAAAERFGRLLLRPDRRDSVRMAGHNFLIELEVAKGRWSASGRETEAVERLGRQGYDRFRAFCGTLPFLPLARADLESIRDEVLRWDSVAPPDAERASDVLAPHTRLYTLGLLSSRLEDPGAALRYAARIDSLPAPEKWRDAVRALAQGVRARVAWRQGRPAEALTLLQAADGNIPIETHGSPSLSQVRERWLRAEVLYQMGRDREALPWFANAFDGAPYELLFLAPAHLRQAEIHDRLGNRADAIRHYTAFVTMWKDADPELQAVVRQARERLAKLAGERRS